MNIRKRNEERIRAAFRKFARKNVFCRALAVPARAVTILLYRILYFFHSNSKRLTLMTASLFLFVVFSSFSFPMFLTTQSMDAYLLSLSDGAEDVDFMPELQVDLAEMELLEEEEFFDGVGYDDAYHELDDVFYYDAEEILKYGEETEGAAAVSEDSEHNDRGSSPAEETAGEEACHFSSDDWRLILVNKQNSIPENYTFTLGNITSGMQCDERIIEDLRAMLRAAREDGVSLVVRSPYRGTERQIMLFDRKIEKYMQRSGVSYVDAYRLASRVVTVPGASEHQIGLALDITTDGYTQLNEAFSDTEAGKWLEEHCCEYGFILRYPEGKEYITGIEYEPWHFRYVGADAATVIMKQGLTLEEFWEEYLD